MRWFPFRDRAVAQSFIWFSSRIGGAISPAIILELADVAGGWRQAFWVLGGVGVAWAFFFYFWFRDRPEEMPAVNRAEANLIRSDATAGSIHDESVTWRRPLGAAVLLDEHLGPQSHQRLRELLLVFQRHIFAQIPGRAIRRVVQGFTLVQRFAALGGRRRMSPRRLGVGLSDSTHRQPAVGPKFDRNRWIRGSGPGYARHSSIAQLHLGNRGPCAWSVPFRTSRYPAFGLSARISANVSRRLFRVA